MTFSEEFVTEPDDFGESQYPTAFGVTLTPSVGGIICGVIGVLGAIYLAVTMVFPAQEAYGQLKADREAKEAQLAQLQSGEAERTLANLEAQLQRSQALEPQVLSLFSSEETLNTLLLDLNRVINASNAQITSYTPEAEATIVDDGSLGELVNGKLKRRSFNMEVNGTFVQTLGLMRDIERLQPLLVVKNLSSQIAEPPSYALSQNKLVIQSPPELQTIFTIDALLPADPSEVSAAEGEEGAAEAPPEGEGAPAPEEGSGE